jgi:hypothetical protein
MGMSRMARNAAMVGIMTTRMKTACSRSAIVSVALVRSWGPPENPGDELVPILLVLVDAALFRVRPESLSMSSTIVPSFLDLGAYLGLVAAKDWSRQLGELFTHLGHDAGLDGEPLLQ